MENQKFFLSIPWRAFFLFRFLFLFLRKRCACFIYGIYTIAASYSASDGKGKEVSAKEESSPPPKKKRRKEELLTAPFFYLSFEEREGEKGAVNSGHPHHTPPSSTFPGRRKPLQLDTFLSPTHQEKMRLFLWGGGKARIELDFENLFALDINESPEGVFWAKSVGELK